MIFNMNLWQTIFLILFSFKALVALIIGLKQSLKGNTFSLTPYLFFLGAFVWADAVIFGIFWVIVSAFCLFTQDWLLFLLITSVFWLVRSAGEVVYWFNQQFSVVERNKPSNMFLFKFFPNDAVWFVFQIIWQCLLVGTIITTVYLFKLWL